jgi:superfamily II DNA helicase RecQ
MMDDSEHAYPFQLATTKLLSNQRSPQKMRSKCEDEHNRSKQQLMMSSNKVWQTTGMPTVATVIRKKNGKTIQQWHVCFLKYPTKATKRVTRKWWACMQQKMKHELTSLSIDMMPNHMPQSSTLMHYLSTSSVTMTRYQNLHLSTIRSRSCQTSINWSHSQPTWP